MILHLGASHGNYLVDGILGCAMALTGVYPTLQRLGILLLLVNLHSESLDARIRLTRIRAPRGVAREGASGFRTEAEAPAWIAEKERRASPSGKSGDQSRHGGT
jgi:hypothetical protein